MSYVAFRVPSKEVLSAGSHHSHGERCSVYRALFYCLSQSLANNSLPPSSSPIGPLWREMPVSTAFLYISFRVPSYGALPPGSPCRAPIVRERERCFISRVLLHMSLKVCGSPTGPLWWDLPDSRVFFTYLVEPPINKVTWKNKISPFSQSPVTEPSLHGPPVGPVWRDITFPDPSHMSLGVSGKDPPSRFPIVASMERDACFRSLVLQISWSPPPWFPSGERCTVSRASGLFIHSYLSESPVKDVSHKMVNTYGHSPWIACPWKAYIQWGAAWFHKVVV